MSDWIDSQPRACASIEADTMAWISAIMPRSILVPKKRSDQSACVVR